MSAAWNECSLLSAVLDVKLAHCSPYLARVCAVSMALVSCYTDLSVAWLECSLSECSLMSAGLDVKLSHCSPYLSVVWLECSLSGCSLA